MRTYPVWVARSQTPNHCKCWAQGQLQIAQFRSPPQPAPSLQEWLPMHWPPSGIIAMLKPLEQTAGFPKCTVGSPPALPSQFPSGSSAQRQCPHGKSTHGKPASVFQGKIHVVMQSVSQVSSDFGGPHCDSTADKDLGYKKQRESSFV